MALTAVPVRAPAAPRARTYALPVLALVLAAALRFIHLGSKSLWTDEAISVAIAQLGWSDFRKVITNHEANMVLYYLLLKLWLRLGGSEFVIRSLSALAAAATVWVVYEIGTQWFGRRTGVIAAALLAVNAYHIRYAQEARGYALVVFLVSLSSLCFVRWVETPSRAVRIAYVISSVLAVYAHMLSGLALLAQWTALPLRSRHETPWPEIRRGVVIICLWCTPLAWFAVFKDSGQIGWIPKPGPREVYQFFYDIAGRGNILLILYLLCATAGVIAVFRLRPATADRWKYQVMWCWFLVPIGISLLVSLRKPLFYPRYLIIVLPAFVLAAAAGLARLRPRALGVLGLIAILVPGVRSTSAWYRASFDPPDQNWRGATQYVVSSSNPGDALLMFHPFTAVDFEYYRARLRSSPELPLRMFPLRGDGVILRTLAPIDSTQLRPGAPLMNKVVGEHERVWLILNTGGPIPEQIQTVLSTTHPISQKRNFGYGIDVYLYSRH